MAKKQEISEQESAVDAAAMVDAFVLRDCGFGKVGQVVSLPESDAAAGASHGMLDLHPAAIAAAKKAE